MTNHPDRTPAPRLPETFRQALVEARQRAMLSQTEAAKLISAGLRTWQQWEAGDRGMPVNAAELWCVAAVAAGHLPASDPLVSEWVRPGILALLQGTITLTQAAVSG